ncbi:multi-copper oxidase laccase-like protein [Melampsora americana]|nr:multi-copper oxidase laccase-like protein [Melampsora americana]
MVLNLRSVICALALIAYQARAVIFNSSELYLSDHEFEITSITRTRNYEFVITNTTGAPDGYTRPLLVINNQLPAPLIRCNEGDTLEIRVDNRLDTDVSIHWHGIWQTGTPWMDGVTGVTQCPIPPGASFTYKFTVAKQFGTFWYHAHTRNLAIDGIAGPLIVHSPRDPLVKGRDFDNEYILFMSDWYHNISTVILNGTLSGSGYFGTPAAPSADSAIINGVGIFNCSFANPGSKCITRKKPLEITVRPNQKTRFRLIQAGSHAMFWFSADQHFLNVTEADSTGVSGPPGLHRLQFHNGERYSVIIDTKTDPDGSSFYLRAAMDTDCWAWLAPGMTGPDATALAIVRVIAPTNGTSNTLPPTTQDWKDTVGGNCTDLNIDLLSPLMTKVCAQTVLGHLFFNTSLGTVLQTNPNNASKLDSLSRFFVDNTTWTNLLKGGKGFVNQSEAATLTLEKPGAYDIVINNLDSAIDHPLHLHGVDSDLVSHGPGNVGPQDLKNLKYRLNNPLRKDTYVVAGGSHLIVRVHIRNIGPFILHCHIGWHLAAGFAGIVVMQPSKLAQLTLPVENQRLCIGKNSSNQNEIEPGRRKRWTDPVFDDTQPMFPRPLKGYYLPNEMVN